LAKLASGFFSGVETHPAKQAITAKNAKFFFISLLRGVNSIHKTLLRVKREGCLPRNNISLAYTVVILFVDLSEETPCGTSRLVLYQSKRKTLGL